MTRSQFSSGHSTRVSPGIHIPAQFTRMSTLPKRLFACPAIASTSPLSDMSTLNVAACLPIARISPATPSSI